MMKTLLLTVVSQEAELYRGEALYVFAKGQEGELGIHPGHSQLLTRLLPGTLLIRKPDTLEELLYVSGGILEVQPDAVTVLADTILRPQDVNEAAALQAKKEAEAILTQKGHGDHDQAMQALAEALAKLQIVELMRLKNRH